MRCSIVQSGTSCTEPASRSAQNRDRAHHLGHPAAHWRLCIQRHRINPPLVAAVYNRPRSVLAQFFWMDVSGHLSNLGWWVTKFGHFIGFGILELLLKLTFRRTWPAVVLSFLFAVATELLQIPLGRDGRLYDVCVDVCGIALFGLIHSIRSARRR